MDRQARSKKGDLEFGSLEELDDLEFNSSSQKRRREVENAVAMLLDLSQSEQIREEDVTNNAPKRLASERDVLNGKLTKKGSSRLGPGDNRVRPPKAATKLLPDAKWRHIRLPDVQSALEAEDWVVMYAHYRCPGACLLEFDGSARD